MKRLLHETGKLQHKLLYGIIMAGTLLLASGCKKQTVVQQVLALTPVATGLHSPIGLEVDKNGWIWVGEGGTGKNDGKVTVITPDGKTFDAIVNFPSVVSPTGEADGPTHLLFADGLLYVLGTAGKMYKADVASFKPGDAPLQASGLGVEDIGAFVLAYPFVNNAHDTHPYNLVVGPNGDIYIADAAANAILRREKNTGALSVVAEVPGVANATTVGPDPIQSVPTGIYYDGQSFLVTTLLGFPFPAGKAVIYRITPAASGPATVALYQQGFTSLIDIAQGGSPGRLVLEHAVRSGGVFTLNTGRLVWANGTSVTVLAEGLKRPTGLKQVDEHTWYVASLGDNSVLKVTY